MCLGSGNCTKIPWTLLSSLASLILANNSSSVVSVGNLIISVIVLISWLNFTLFLTYISLLGLLPTKKITILGTTLYFLFISSTSNLTSCLISFAIFLPSISVIIFNLFITYNKYNI